MERYKQFFKEIKQSRLAHGNLGKTSSKYKDTDEAKNMQKIRIKNRVEYIGNENPSDKLEGLHGIVIAKDKNPRFVIVLFDNGKKILVNKNDLKII